MIQLNLKAKFLVKSKQNICMIPSGGLDITEKDPANKQALHSPSFATEKHVG